MPLSDDAILDDLIRRESREYTNHPEDRGGPTKFGITQRTLAGWRKADVSADDVRDLTELEARDIYRAKYLAPFDGFDLACRAQLVDIAVNSGVTRANALLSIATQRPDKKQSLGTALAIERLRFYARIVRDDPSQSKFILGWVNRAVEFI